MPTSKRSKILLISLLFIMLFTAFAVAPAKAAQVSLEGKEYTTVNKKTDNAAANNLAEPIVIADPETGEIIIGQNTNAFDTLLLAIKERIANTEHIVRDKDTLQPLTTAQGEPVYYTEKGAVASIMDINLDMYNNPPASGIVYAQQEWEKITTGHVVHAQDSEDSWIYYPGLGYNVLKPIQDFWSITRNIAYLALIIIIIIVAFLVAFRANMGGQAQVTIANSIPNIVIALIMITLSYPLSGLAIDTITIGANLVQQVLVQNTWSPGYNDVWEPEGGYIDKLGLDTDNYDLDTKLENPKYHLQIDDPAMSAWQAFMTADVNIVESDNRTSIVPDINILNGLIENALESMLGNELGAIFVQLIFVIAALMASIKIFLKLLTKYLILVIYPIVSPFIMLSIAIPGQGAKTIANYFKTIFAAALSFVAVYAVFLFMVVITHHSSFLENFTLTPPLLGYSSEGAEATNLIQIVIAFALFMTAPTVPDMIDQALGTLPDYVDRFSPAQRVRSAVIGGVSNPKAIVSPGNTGIAGGFQGASNVVSRVKNIGGPKPKRES